ncbi:MAG: NmrA family NAD(P)-binding protein [Azonexus sp.]|jgi:uncharacterized protein YbjT (DUF2867 family)|nr:NmrA family NAD(P)-binding protein [Azonexus sp.]
MSYSASPVLVTGATGAQGGATARALLAAGFPVRILTRDPQSPTAQALLTLGAEVIQGDMNEPASLVVAAEGAYGLFSVQRPDVDGSDSERRHGYALLEAARQCGVRHLVHTSVCEAGRHQNFPGWENRRWYQKYWTDKWDIEEKARHAGFLHWTILKPAFMMDNFAQPKARSMFPHLQQGRIITALRPDTRLQLTCADDVGAFAAAAFAAPARFDRRNIDLGAEALTMTEVAAILSRLLQKRAVAESVSPDEAKAAGLNPGWVRTQEWINEVGYRADLESLKGYGIPLTSFTAWIERHADQIVIDTQSTGAAA